MGSAHSLDLVYFISVPEGFQLSPSAFPIDVSIPLPVQKKDEDAPGNFNMKELAPEQVLAGILTVLAYDRHNPHTDYYRSIVVKARPDIKKELTEAAILKAKNEDWELAEELFITLRGLDPEDPAAALNMALFLDQRAESYRRSGLHEDADAYDNDALQYYAEAMDAEPPLPDAYFNAGFFYMKQHDFHEAKGCFETFLALTCDAKDEELGENGIYKKERAQEVIDAISNGNMDDEAFRSAYQLISSGQEEKGLERLRGFLQNNPKVWNAWFLLGWGLRRLERWQEARQAFEQAVSCGGDGSADTHNELAICLMELQDAAGAKRQLLRALALAPEDAKIISNLGFLALKEGDRQEARRFFATVLEYAPDDAIAAAELAKLEAGS
ncbi:MAG: tetratricopeptide repeat protein [Treponemataceae bacterium]|nr:tetratricopeptide repeat protein [Treponemataceae bacterium]